MAKDLLGGITLTGEVCGGWQIEGKPLGSGMPQRLATGWSEALNNFVGSDMNPIYMLATQLVNGINYALVTEITVVVKDPIKKIGIVIVNVPFNMTGEGSKIIKVIDTDKPNVPTDILALFNSATKDLIGAVNTPILFLGNQIVNGQMFYLICESKPVRPGANPVANLCKLWLKPDGTTEVKFERIPKR